MYSKSIHEFMHANNHLEFFFFWFDGAPSDLLCGFQQSIEIALQQELQLISSKNSHVLGIDQLWHARVDVCDKIDKVKGMYHKKTCHYELAETIVFFLFFGYGMPIFHCIGEEK
jgi:hypothetical protein